MIAPLDTFPQSGSLRKFSSRSGEAVIVVVEARELLEGLLRRQRAHPAAFLHIGQASLAALMLEALTDPQDEERIELQWSVQGVFGNLHAASPSLGLVRASIAKPEVETVNLSESLGDGLLQVRHVRDATNLKSVGIVESQGTVGPDLVEYLERSEQKSCGISLSVKLAFDGNAPDGLPYHVAQAHGYLVHILPQGNEKTFERTLLSWDTHMKELGPLSQWELPMDAAECTKTMASFLDAREVSEFHATTDLALYCTCSQERASRALGLLSERDRDYLTEGERPEDGVRMHCEFCGADYLIPMTVA